MPAIAFILAECGKCNGKIRTHSHMSTNDYGHTRFNSGIHHPQRNTYNYYIQDTIIKCPYCSTITWKSDLKKSCTTTDQFATIQEDYKPHALSSLDDHFEALTTTDDPSKLLQIRIAIWWMMNCNHRSGDGHRGFDQAEVENMRAILPLLNMEDDSHKLIAAEINRNLCQYDEAVAILDGIIGHDLAATKIRALALANENIGIVFKPSR